MNSCNNKQETKVPTTYAEFKVLNNEFMFGSGGYGLYVLNNFIVWSNLKASDNFLHIMNKENGERVYLAGKIGYKENEYISPFVVKTIWNNYLFVYDLMGHTKRYFTVNSLINEGDGFVELSKADSLIRAKGYDMRLENDLYIAFNSKDDDTPYRLYFNGLEKNFGKYILKDEKQHFYPTTLYNPDKKLLIMGSGVVNYFCCYKWEGSDFKLMWENRHHYVYGKHHGLIIFDNSRVGAYDIALTKDFIVTIQRNYENDRTSETAAMKDFRLLPQTLFVYNYDGKLLKIINYKVAISNIAGDIQTNKIYAIFANPDFMLGVTTIE